MDCFALRSLLKLRGLSQSDLARIAGVSRQAVSAWFKNGRDNQPINLHSANLQKLCDGLNIRMESLLKPSLLVSDPKKREDLEASLLWDRLFPDLEGFIVALVRKDLRALARLVQVYGLFQAQAVIDPSVWKRFHRYKKNLHPVRREECERIWNLQKNLGLI